MNIPGSLQRLRSRGRFVYRSVRQRGLRRTLNIVLRRAIPEARELQARVTGARGVEIGGPSGAFGDSGILPIYHVVGSMDNCVYSGETIWEGKRSEGPVFTYHPTKKPGYNYIRDATDLHGMPSDTYDLLLAAHALEHIANPVKALREWQRVLKPGATMVVVLPHYRETFDHRRAPTPVEHMLADFHRGTTEEDLTHLNENLELHDMARDPDTASIDIFRGRALDNFRTRALHHHVFDEQNSRRLLEASGVVVDFVRFAEPHHIVLVARVPAMKTA